MKPVQAYPDTFGGLHRTPEEACKANLWAAEEAIAKAVQAEHSRLYRADVDAVLRHAGVERLRRLVAAHDALAAARVKR